ncbi:MAG: isoprenyl transferase [Bacteroidota bacterium]
MKALLIVSIALAALLLVFGLVQGRHLALKRTSSSVAKATIQSDNLPQHVAVMLDGNGRWAKKQGQPRTFGHRNSLQSLRELIEGCIELGVSYLSLYAFSTENWARPKEEVEVLMELITTTLQSELTNLMDKDIKLTAIGDITRLPQHCQEALHKAIEATKHNKGLQLIVALSYSGRWEITEAAKAIAQDVLASNISPADINAELFQHYLSTRNIPDPDLLIRTGGDMRISNFLLWQLAYTELFFAQQYWPEFRKEHLYEVIAAYQKRERRLGRISE